MRRERGRERERKKWTVMDAIYTQTDKQTDTQPNKASKSNTELEQQQPAFIRHQLCWALS